MNESEANISDTLTIPRSIFIGPPRFSWHGQWPWALCLILGLVLAGFFEKILEKKSPLLFGLGIFCIYGVLRICYTSSLQRSVEKSGGTTLTLSRGLSLRSNLTIPLEKFASVSFDVVPDPIGGFSAGGFILYFSFQDGTRIEFQKFWNFEEIKEKGKEVAKFSNLPFHIPYLEDPRLSPRQL